VYGYVNTPKVSFDILNEINGTLSMFKVMHGIDRIATIVFDLSNCGLRGFNCPVSDNHGRSFAR
jgi:hypothetical protein